MSWSPSLLAAPDEDLLARIAALYENDPLLGEALRIASDQQAMAGAMPGAARLRGSAGFVGMMNAAARFLDAPDGPRIAALDFDGFDTHVRQQSEGAAGRLPALLRALDQGLRSYRENTRDPVWRNTLIYVVTEFGRTVRPNGSGGTDHDTASLALLIGGAVEGGRVIAQWPGLAEHRLYQGRDLQPTTDLRAVSKHLLMAHYQIPAAEIGRHILPGTAALAPVEVLRA